MMRSLRRVLDDACIQESAKDALQYMASTFSRQPHAELCLVWGRSSSTAAPSMLPAAKSALVPCLAHATKRAVRNVPANCSTNGVWPTEGVSQLASIRQKRDLPVQDFWMCCDTGVG